MQKANVSRLYGALHISTIEIEISSLDALRNSVGAMMLAAPKSAHGHGVTKHHQLHVGVTTTSRLHKRVRFVQLRCRAYCLCSQCL